MQSMSVNSTQDERQTWALKLRTRIWGQVMEGLVNKFYSTLNLSREGGISPGGPVVKTSRSNAGGMGSIPGQGAKIPHALQSKKHKTEAIM